MSPHGASTGEIAVFSRITPAFLPVVAVEGHRGMPGYVEALLRTSHPDGHGALIRRAEEDRTIWLLDVAMLSKVAKLLQQTRRDLRVGLNVSAVTVQDKASTWLTKLADAGRGVASRVVVELTETAVQIDPERTVHFVDQCRALGASVAVDDYDSDRFDDDLVYRLRPDYIKVGNGWKPGCPQDTGDRLARSLARIAAMGVSEVVVEWIDSEWRKLVAESFGVSHLQGTYFGGHYDSTWARKEFGLASSGFGGMARA